MGLTDLVTPEATPHRHDGELGQDDGATDSGGHLLAALHTKTHVALVVTNGHESLKYSSNYISNIKNTITSKIS